MLAIVVCCWLFADVRLLLVVGCCVQCVVRRVLRVVVCCCFGLLIAVCSLSVVVFSVVVRCLLFAVCW